MSIGEFAPGADFIRQFRLFDRSGSTGKRTAKVSGTVHCFMGATETSTVAAHVDYDDSAVYIGGQLVSDESTDVQPAGTWQFKIAGTDITAAKNATAFPSGRAWLIIEVAGSVLEALPINVVARKRAASSTVLE